MRGDSKSLGGYVFALVAAAGFLLAGHSAQAADYYFNAVTNNSVMTVNAAEAQLMLTVTEPVSGTAYFQFSNTGPVSSSLANVYFDDDDLAPLLTSNVAFAYSGTVVFQEGGTPSNLPSGNMLNPDFMASMVDSATNPKSKNGVNPGESLTIEVDLTSGKHLSDVIAAINSEALRIGIHVISIDDGMGGSQSESLVAAVPSPTTGTIAMGATIFGLLARRREA